MREPSINLLRRARPPRQLELLNEVADQQRDLVLYLTRTQPWDLCFVVFRTTDHAHHAFLGTAAEEVQGTYRLSGSTGEIIRRHYQHLDTLLGELVEHVPEATFVVMSDHGTALQPYTLYLNEWLRQEGLLTWLPFFSRSHLGGCTRERTVGRWLRSLRMQFLSPLFSKETLTRSVRLPAVDKILSSQGGVQWSQTQAFLDLAAVSAFRLNVQEREGQGAVAPDGLYEELREKLITRLPQLRHPHLDEPAIESVNRREEVYQGPFASQGPDLLIVTRGDRYRIQDRRSSGAVFGPTPRRSWGQHHRHGILLLAGSPVRSAELGLSQMVDIAPTVLYLLGHPIPAHFDGRVLTEALKPEVLDERPVLWGPPEKEWLRTPTVERYEDEAAIRRHLQDLGYL
jgi:predicted AlkP superfamily phosphohydrolase/phosphomutase